MAKLRVEVVTGERLVYTQDEVDMVVAPGADGVLGILPRHAPLITILASGELRIKKGGREESLVVFGGFMEVTPEKVIVLAYIAEHVEDMRQHEALSRIGVDYVQGYAIDRPVPIDEYFAHAGPRSAAAFAAASSSRP